jgi:pimeloyl-ACP methyl ester carboxylesterase
MNIPHPAAMQANMSLRQLRHSWYMFFFQIPKLPEFILTARGGQAVERMFRETSCHPERWSDEDLAVYREAVCRPGAATAMINYYRALFRRPGARRQRQKGYPPVDTRTLMIWGEQDVALTKELTYGTERYVPNLTLHYLPDVSHWTQQDDPETVNRLLEDWLAAGG